MKKSTLLYGLCWGLSAPVWALQSIVLNEGGTLNTLISDQELTRFSIQGDRIQTVHGLSGRYQVTTDEVQGDIYLKAENESADGFSVFLTTEHGRHVILQLSPKPIPSDAVVITLSEPHIAPSLTHEDQLIQLMKQIMDAQTPNGYTTKKVESTPLDLMEKKATIALLEELSNDLKSIQIFGLRNMTDAPLELKETDFFAPHTQAIACDKRILKPHGFSKIFRIVGHD